MTQIIKKQTLLEIIDVDDEGTTFANGFDETEATVGLALTREVWEDLGKPSQITMTIEPGDKLNEDPA